jgi:hypothetical protein
MRREAKAISSIILILLILCSVIIGALISYLWVMASFYAEPENTVDIVITDVDFPVNHADYFNITVMNPSHSSSSTNITRIFFAAEGNDTLFEVTNTSPGELPIILERGASKAIKCKRNWGAYAGKVLTVHVLALDGSGATRSFETQLVKLNLQTYFNATETVKKFNATLRNDESSAINVTLSNVYLDDIPVENMSIELPRTLAKGESVAFECFSDWQTHVEPIVKAETTEGYFVELRKTAPSTVALTTIGVSFNETDSNMMSVGYFNSPESATLVDIEEILLTDKNKTKYHINGTSASPSLPYRLEKNSSVTFDFTWSWTSYRNESIIVTALTRQGFNSTTIEARTPASVVFRIAALDFNLTDTGSFRVNVTNMGCSLQSVTVNKILFNGVEVAIQPSSQLILHGDWAMFNCTHDWASLIGTSVNVTACTEDGLNASKTTTLPAIDLRIMDATFNASTGIPYLNITVFNTAFSTRNTTITQIVFVTQNATETADGTLTSPALAPSGCLVSIGTSVTIVCPWHWTTYLGQDLTIRVNAAEGFTASLTIQIPDSLP